ncbi:MAG: c-type cytochrome [Cyclobacteriaceae bacterium]|nr:c-type cytochrome [Cyclobacteriaceae bacterium]
MMVKITAARYFIFFVILLGIALTTCTSGNNSSYPDSVKYQQYYVQGGELYKNYCANCHQPDGSGLGRVYPPLNKSDFMEQNFEEVVCLIKFGRSGELWVNGTMYNQPMKSNPSLTELEIAEIATFIYNSWDIKNGIVEVGQVTQALTSCAVR